MFSKMQKRVAKTLIKPVELENLWDHFWEMALEMIKKSIRFFSKSWWRFTTLRNVKKALVLEHFGASKKVDQNTL